MARLVGTLRIEVRGLDNLKASIGSIYEAANNACLDLEFAVEDGSFVFDGMTITRMDSVTSDSPLTAVLQYRPAAGMILFIGWLMAKLPPLATVKWRDGWPHVYCPPNDDQDFEDDPTPLVPNELVPA